MITTLQINVDRSGGYFFYCLLKELHRTLLGNDRSVICSHRFRAETEKWPDMPFDFFSVDHLSILDGGCYLDVDLFMRERIVDVGAYVNNCTHVISDSALCERHEKVLPLFAHVFYLVRDPRAVCASWHGFSRSPYYRRYGRFEIESDQQFFEHMLPVVLDNWRSHVGTYLPLAKAGNVELVRYEDLTDDFEAKASGFVRSLTGRGPSDHELQHLKDSVSFERMKSLNPMHLQKGPRQSPGTLPPDVVEWIETTAESEMRDLGYLEH